MQHEKMPKPDLGDVLDALIRSLGLSRTLEEVGVGRNKFKSIAEDCLQDSWVKSNPLPLTKSDQVLEIFQMVAYTSAQKTVHS